MIDTKRPKIIIKTQDNTISNILSTNPDVEIVVVEFDKNCPKEDDILNNTAIDDFVDDDKFVDVKYLSGKSDNNFFDL